MPIQVLEQVLQDLDRVYTLMRANARAQRRATRVRLKRVSWAALSSAAAVTR
jgi:hypothetical protein